MIDFSRNNQSILVRWWWTVDRATLFLILSLMAYGAIMIVAASPSVATRIGLSNFYFVKRHLLLLLPTIGVMFFISMLNPKQLRFFGVLLFLSFYAFVIMTLFYGTEIKGARRWVNLAGLSLQPSEFLKPAFILVTAFLCHKQIEKPGFKGKIWSFVLYLFVVAGLVLQPDMGMTFLVSLTWFFQLYLAGMPYIFIFALGGMGAVGAVGAYFFLPHFSARINKFLDPSSGDNYQIDQSIDAFVNGGIFGTGPGQGTVKMYLPDAHADFIFAVVGEEFGLVWCVVLVFLYGALIMRNFYKLGFQKDYFIVLTVGGVLFQFALQALINMASSLNLIPTKGMTLPFVSYGGSSLIAIGIGAGILLALTKRNLYQSK